MIDTLATLLAGRQPACGATTVVAVDGPSGSGKTSIARGLADRVGADVLTVDELVPGWHGLAEVPGRLAGLLGGLALGAPARAPSWDWVADRPGPDLVVPPVRVLVLDGCGSGSRSVRPFLSLLVWVEAPEPVRHARAMARDGEAYGPWWPVWAAQERSLFAAEGTRAAADVRCTTG